MQIVLVAVGSALGGIARWGLTGLIDARLGTGFPWGILTVNVVGSLLIGVLAAAVERDAARLLLITGVLGGFTTFSTFSLQTLTLMQDGRLPAAMAYALGSVATCLLACWAGWALTRAVVAGS